MNLSKPSDNVAPRRTQFSSCDGCRGSRLACDAVRVGLEPGKPGESGSCSRCIRRGQKCTFEWIKTVKRPATRPRRASRAAPAPAGQSQASSSSPESVAAGHATRILTTSPEPHIQRSPECYRELASQSQSPAAILHPPRASSRPGSLEDAMARVGGSLERIFESCYENVFGFWMGRHCCPLVADLDSDIILRPTRLFTELDACIAEDREAGQSHVGSSMSPSPSRQELDRQIDVSLRHAIRSFAARWLHLVPQAEPFVPPHQCIVRELWRASRRDMLKVINRVSYRSVLTLFLFGLTPIPVGVSEEEEMDGLTGQICVQTALQQVQRLRERQRNYQFNGSKVSLGPDVSMSMSSSPAPTPSSNITSTFLSAESRAYWGALIFDTSASLTLNFRSSLTSGLHGVGTESSWQALKMGAGSFHTRTEEWRRGSVELTEDMVKQVIAAASAGNLYLLKMIAVLKEALREGYEEKKLAGAWTCALEALDMFKVTFLPLLRLCQRRLRFLGQVERLNWYELMLHHFLGILLLIDGIEAADRSDLLSQLTETRADAEREILNTLQFGLDSTYLVHGVHHTNTVTNTVTNTNTNTNTSTNTSTNSLLGNNPLSGNTDTNPLLGNTNTNPLSGVQSTNTNTNTNTNPLSGALGNFALSRSSVLSASFVAIDPFPHHVVAAVQLMHKVVSREYDQRRITLDTCQRLTSTLLQALEHAPQTSKSVDAARQELSGELEILMSGRRR